MLTAEMTMGIGFSLVMGIPWEWDKHQVNCGNENVKRSRWEWQ